MTCNTGFVYNRYSDYLINKYGARVYKLPVQLPVSCPNREHGGKGCTFCGEKGAGFETLTGSFSVSEQIAIHRKVIGKKYKAEYFIAYFQNYTNTYLPLDEFKAYIEEAVQPGIVEIAVSTRPDCVNDTYLDFLAEVSRRNQVKISIEMGLQTCNYQTLKKINRGHGLAEYIDAALRIKPYGFPVCTHLILNLPWDTDADAVECAKILSVLKTEQVKLHALYIVRNTKMAQQYEDGEFTLISAEEYIERVILFLQYLAPDVVIQRVIGRAPQGDTLFANWGTSWWKIHDEIVARMQKRNQHQGQMFNYTNGSALY